MVTDENNSFRVELSDSDEDEDDDHSDLDLKELLKMQLTEFEMLQAMFPNPGEFIFNYGIVLDIEDFIGGRRTEKPPQLNFIINLEVATLKLEINVNFPSLYPHIKPEIFIRSSQFNRTEQRNLNQAFDSNLNLTMTLSKNEIIMGSVIAWLQENSTRFLNASENPSIHENKSGGNNDDSTFSRLWIYSHHIYSKVKRKTILELAHRYDISGFCLPGKPGIICVEGKLSDCEEWWSQVKNMTWKKIGCIKKEETKLISNINEFRKFSDFQEISFNQNKTKKQNHHMDFGEFYKYLKANDCEYMFKTYFGIDGK